VHVRVIIQNTGSFFHPGYNKNGTIDVIITSTLHSDEQILEVNFACFSKTYYRDSSACQKL